MPAFAVTFPDGRTASAVRLQNEEDVPSAARELGLEDGTSCLVLVGGADQMSDDEIARANEVVRHAVVPTAERLGAVVIDGGTDSGVMALMGRARAAARASFPLVGVVVERLAALPGQNAPEGAAPLEPNHTHFVLVPGSAWGDEAGALSQLAAAVAPRRSATILLNGGELSRRDVSMSIDQGRSVVAVAGTGRLADALAGDAATPRLIRAVDAGDLDTVCALIDNLLTVDP